MSQPKKICFILLVSFWLTAAITRDAYRKFCELEKAKPSPQLIRLMVDSHPSKQK